MAAPSRFREPWWLDIHHTRTCRQRMKLQFPIFFFVSKWINLYGYTVINNAPEWVGHLGTILGFSFPISKRKRPEATHLDGKYPYTRNSNDFYWHWVGISIRARLPMLCDRDLRWNQKHLDYQSLHTHCFIFSSKSHWHDIDGVTAETRPHRVISTNSSR